MPLTTRAAKGSNLTPAEADAIITKVNTITSAIGGDGVANPAALEAALAAVRAPGGGGGASTYAALTDRATANLPGINTPLAQSLAGKQAVGSTYAINDVAGLRAELDSKASATHGHAIDQVAGLSVALAAMAADIALLKQGGSPGQVPSNTSAPAISGVASVGATLATSNGLWTGSPASFGYQWLRSSVAIPGATAANYLIAPADAAATLSVTVTAINSSGQSSATSAPTAAVSAAPGNTAAPAITGTPAVGQLLSATTGTWTGSPTGYAYQWLRASVAIAGATTATYLLVAADGGNAVAVRVTATNAAGSSQVVSAPVSAVDLPSMLAPPTIGGTPSTGNFVSAAPGSWTGSPTFAYQWKRAGANIAGATAATRQMIAADEGALVTVAVTATNAAGATSATSAGVTGLPAGVQTDAASNPVTVAITGTRTFNVGPGQTYTEPDTVPWGSLVAGDVVNIFHRPAPYKWKVGLRGQGTQASPIVVNGVTDAAGTRPQFDFDGSRTASGSNPGGVNNVFTATPQYGESLGGFVIKRGPSDDYFTYKPKWIELKNLDLTGAQNGTSYTTLAGGTATHSSSGALFILLGADILVDNCVLTNSGFGVFMMAKDGDLTQACERVTVRHCRVFNNGVSGSYLEHNFYVQGTSPVIEGNYIGQTRPGSFGSSYKSRTSNEVFRYNYVEASARAVDFVHAEEQDAGVAIAAGYGIDYVYGNVIVNDHNLPNGGAGNPIHFGGDNLGEDDFGPLVVPTSAYRSKLHFFGNTVIHRASAAQSYRVAMFDISLVAGIVEAWNNVFVLQGDANFTWTEWVGTLNLRGANLVYGSIIDARTDALAGRYSVNRIGTLLTSNPTLVDLAGGDYRLANGSPAINQAGPVPAGVNASIAALHPVNFQPRLKTNGVVARPVIGTAYDLGALENGAGTGAAPSAPANTAAPVISGAATSGSVLTASTGSWSGSPTGYAYQWKKAGANIAGATATTYASVAGDVGAVITVTVAATNAVGTASATSAGVTILAANLPGNTVLPAITGTAQVGQTLTSSTGTWTNSPTGYAYQWRRAGTPIGGATAATYLLQAADNGSSVSCTVTATNANGSSAATSAGVNVVGGSLGPDGNGLFTFDHANGTSLEAVNGSWLRLEGGAIEYEVQANGVQAKAGTGFNGTNVSFSNAQANDQTSKGRVLLGAGAAAYLSINNNGTNSYYVYVSSTSVQLRRVTEYIDQVSHGVNLATNSAAFTLKRVGSVVTVLVNGVQVMSYTDNFPLSGGFPGFVLYPASATASLARLEAWTDNDAATV